MTQTVAVVSLAGGYVLLENDDIINIDSYMNLDGEIFYSLPQTTVACVLAPYKGGWLTVDMENHQNPEIH